MSNAPRPSRRPTRAESAELDELIRKAAVEAFLENGFHGTSMDAVARAAGITRRTLYARYPDKQALFGDAIRWALSRSRADDPPTHVGGGLAACLVAIARAALTRSLDPDVIRLSLLLMTESVRFPELVPKDLNLTWSPRLRAVMEVLRLHAEAGTVLIDDLELTAEQFLAVVTGLPARLAAFGLRRSPEFEERHIEHAVNLFLKGVLA